MPSTSKKQQRFFGAVMSAKKGGKGITGAAKKAAKGMSKKSITDFLKLKKESLTFKSYFKSIYG